MKLNAQLIEEKIFSTARKSYKIKLLQLFYSFCLLRKFIEILRIYRGISRFEKFQFPINDGFDSALDSNMA
jgi:hypothetical protein